MMIRPLSPSECAEIGAAGSGACAGCALRWCGFLPAPQPARTGTSRTQSNMRRTPPMLRRLDTPSAPATIGGGDSCRQGQAGRRLRDEGGRQGPCPGAAPDPLRASEGRQGRRRRRDRGLAARAQAPPGVRARVSRRRPRRRVAREREGQGGALVRRQIELSNDVAAALTGSNDQVLRALEEHLGCDVYLRGNLVTLDGDAEDVQNGATVVRELSELIEQGHEIGPGTISAVTDALDQHHSPAEILEDVVWRHRSAKAAPK